MSGTPGMGQVQRGEYPPPESDTIEVVVNVRSKGASPTLIVTKQRIRVEGRKLAVVPGSGREEEIEVLRFA